MHPIASLEICFISKRFSNHLIRCQVLPLAKTSRDLFSSKIFDSWSLRKAETCRDDRLADGWTEWQQRLNLSPDISSHDSLSNANQCWQSCQARPEKVAFFSRSVVSRQNVVLAKRRSERKRWYRLQRKTTFFVENVKKSLLSKYQSAGKIFVRSLSCKIFVLPSSSTFKSWSEAANIDKTNMRLHYWSHCCCLDDDWLAFRSQLLKPMSKCLPSCFHEKLISARIKITQNPGQ